MNLKIVRKLTKHQDLTKILKEIQENGQKTLVTVYDDTKRIHKVIQRLKQDTSHRWWDIIFGWSPTATGILNPLLHSVIAILMLAGINFVVSIMIYVWN